MYVCFLVIFLGAFLSGISTVWWPVWFFYRGCEGRGETWKQTGKRKCHFQQWQKKSRKSGVCLQWVFVWEKESGWTSELIQVKEPVTYHWRVFQACSHSHTDTVLLYPMCLSLTWRQDWSHDWLVCFRSAAGVRKKVPLWAVKSNGARNPTITHVLFKKEPKPEWTKGVAVTGKFKQVFAFETKKML